MTEEYRDMSAEGTTPDDAERVLRAGLEAYDLDEADLALLAGEEPEDAEAAARALPVVAVIGRPNVGKSSLVNRIVGKRVAVVQDVPGVTRDRVSYEAEWADRRFLLMDTGGWERDVAGLDRDVALQAEIAIEQADAVIFVVDATVGMTDTDEALVRVLRRSRKPVIVAANKVDSPQQEPDAAYLWSLGLGEPYPVSALHGRGSGDLLDVVIRALPEEREVPARP
ncbi:GTPase, partial [Actinotignum timonense]